MSQTLLQSIFGVGSLNFLSFIGEELEWILMTLKVILPLVDRSNSILLLQNYKTEQRTNLLKFEENIGYENGLLPVVFKSLI